MSRRSKIGIALLACGFIGCAMWIAERKTRAWRIPSYHVSVPAEFDFEDAEGHGKGRETFRYSPRVVYLDSHRRGWEKAKSDWIRGRNLSNNLAQVIGMANQASQDGWQQFHREKGMLW